jgi:uncharacterized membrane protein YebE (DUF533 family)
VFPLGKKECIMASLQELKAQILADGKIDDAEVEVLRKELYADGKIDRDEVEFLVSPRNEAKSACPAFEQLFFQALKENVLADGSVDADEAACLRQALYADGKVDEAEKRFLRELRAEARQVSPEFQRLCDEALGA